MGGCGSAADVTNVSQNQKVELKSVSSMNLHKAGNLLDMDDMNKKTRVEASNVAETLNHLGRVCLSQHKFTDSKNFFERALKIYESSVDKTDISCAETRQDLGKTLLAFGRHEDGLRFWLGMNLSAEQKFREAVTLLESALPPFEETHGKDSVITAKVYAGYAEALSACEKFVEADEYFHKAIEIMDKSLTFNTSVTPRGIECLFDTEEALKKDFALSGGNGMEITVFDMQKGGALDRSGVRVGMELFEAKEHSGKRLVISVDSDIESLLESLHIPCTLYFRERLYVDALHTLTNWAISLKESGKFRDSRQNFMKAVGICEFLYGDSSLQFAELEKEFAHGLQKEGRFEEAYRRYNSAFGYHQKHSEKLLKELESKVGGAKGKTLTDDRLAIPTFLMLGMTQVLIGSVRPNEGLQHAEKTVKLATKCYGPEHAVVGFSQNMAGTCLYILKRYAEAADMFKVAYKTYSIALDDQHPATIFCIANRACCLARDKPGLGIDANTEGIGEEHEEALKLFEITLELYAAAQLGDHLCVASIYSNIAFVHQRMGHFDKARESQALADEIREKRLGAEHVLIGLSHLNSSQALLLNKQHDEAQKKAAMAHDIFQKALGNGHECVAAANMVMGNAMLVSSDPQESFDKFEAARQIRADSIDQPKRRLILHECARLSSSDATDEDHDAFENSLLKDARHSEEMDETETEKETTEENTTTDREEDGAALCEIGEGNEDEDENLDVEAGEKQSKILGKVAQEKKTSAEKSHLKSSAGPATGESHGVAEAKADGATEAVEEQAPRVPLAGEASNENNAGVSLSSIIITDQEPEIDRDEISYCSSSMSHDEGDLKRKGMAGRATIEFENVNLRECVGVCAEWTDTKSARDVFVNVNIEVIPDNHVGKQGVSKPLLKSRQPFCILLQQGSCSFVDKAICAKEVGAIGFVVFRKDQGKPFVMSHTSVNAEPPELPGIMVSQEVGEKLYGACMGQQDPRITRLLNNKRPEKILKSVEKSKVPAD
eukprot:GEMP01007647.1.p1 GENE.GEMP01007647.1~~GEMP01007647.1.p1  ORF type:complete len:1008 (+),score=217.09 GEMP01007647.1:242-3265(+)